MSEEKRSDETEVEEAVAADEAASAEAPGSEQEPPGEDRVAVLESENAELKDRILRTMAEMENVRRRAERDKADAGTYSITRFARDMLSVSDNLRRALDTLPEAVADDLKPFIEGVEMTERELLNNFEKHGITRVEPQAGDKFDHNRHQAMFEVPTPDHAPGSVVQVVAHGYIIKDRLLRPAMVGVAKAVDETQKVDTTA